MDLYHFIGSDIQVSNNGNAVLAKDEVEGQQRVLRRLLTNPQSYVWSPQYGAGLAKFIGQPLVQARIKGTIQQQMLLEKAVLQNPPPVITLSVAADQTVTATIIYVDATTNLRSQLELPIEGF